MSVSSRGFRMRALAGIAMAVLVPACSPGSSGPQGPPGSTDAWSRTGNSGTTPGLNFLGTSDNVALEIHVDSARAIRIEPGSDPFYGSSPNLIGGFPGNSAAGGIAGATVAGGGGSAGPSGGPNQVGGSFATVSGGTKNSAGSYFSTVAGGFGNVASADNASVSGGESNTASGSYAVIGGGRANTAIGTNAFLGGGWQNNANGYEATLSGGEANFATGSLSTIAGGKGNYASSNYATISGGAGNQANAPSSTVVGGADNTASGWYSTVVGGTANSATGLASLAAGVNAHAVHDGAFVWADENGPALSSTAADQFVARATGGFLLYSNSGATVGVALAPGSGSWSTISDRDQKSNFLKVDIEDILRRVESLAVSTWNYKSQSTSVRHIGPMAQDFKNAFSVGEDERHISTVDAQGVAFAAIQGVCQRLRDQDERIRVLERNNAKLEARLEAIEKALSVSASSK